MTGYESKRSESNPKMYREILETLYVELEETVMIGDNIPIDIILPKKLGIKTILLNRSKKKIECKQADAIVDNLSQAVKVMAIQLL